MLHIIYYKNYYGDETTPKTWHVGEDNPIDCDASFDVNNVFEVQADGQELLYIVSRMSNIPYSSKSVQRWFGDMAKFIACSLDRY